LEEDGLDLDEEEMAMITKKFKKFFKKAKENSIKKNFSQPKSSSLGISCVVNITTL